MIDLHYWTTPNRHKITILLEEAGIAYMAAYPWIVPHERQKQKLEDFPFLWRWFDAMRERPAVKRAHAKAAEINTKPNVDESSKKILFGQTNASISR